MGKNSIEFQRKAIHISSIIIPLSFRYIFGYSRRLMILILFPMAIISIFIELLRLEHLTSKGLFHRFFGGLLRNHEKMDVSGASYLVVSAILVIAFLPKDISFCALSFLSIGDTVAALIGINFGKRKIRFVNKSLEGSLACFVATFVFALIFVHPFIALLGAIAATLAELSPIDLDDNIKIPIFSGAIMWIADLSIVPIGNAISVLKIYVLMILKAIGLW